MVGQLKQARPVHRSGEPALGVPNRSPSSRLLGRAAQFCAIKASRSAFHRSGCSGRTAPFPCPSPRRSAPACRFAPPAWPAPCSSGTWDHARSDRKVIAFELLFFGCLLRPHLTLQMGQPVAQLRQLSYVIGTSITASNFPSASLTGMVVLMV